VETIILASGSPNRRALLEQVGIPFRVIVPEIDERGKPAESIEERARRLAREKVACVAAQLEKPQRRWVVGFDTLIGVQNRIIGKLETRHEAREVIVSLAGRSHCIVTAVALLSKPDEEIKLDTCSTTVTFRAMTEQEIEYYLNTGEWQNAAGAYRIQSRGALFVESLHGSYSNVVGLPLSLLYGMLRGAGYRFS
jgi:septum formation protein